MIVQMPLYSLRAWGKFYGPYPFGSFYPEPWRNCGYCVYQRRKHKGKQVTYKITYTKPFNPQSENQQLLRASFASGVRRWQGLTTSEKEIYNNYTYPTRVLGYHRFLHYYLLANNPLK